jgi:HK97 family phage portal protein
MWPFTKRQDRALWQVGDIYTSGPRWPGDLAGRTRSGVRVDADQALRLSAVWACRRLLADTISSLPVDAYRQGSRTPIDPPPPILVTPAADCPLDEWLDMIVMAATGGGNAFGLVTDRIGAAMRPSQIELVDPSRVAPTAIAGAAVEWRLDGREIDTSDLWHFRRYPVAGQALSLSPIGYAAESVGLGLGAQDYGAKFFGDDATPAGILTSDQSIPPGEAENMAAKWWALRTGNKRTAVLGNGLTYQAISIAPEESQFLESQRFSVQQVARIYGIAPELIGSDSGASMTYSNIESRDLTLLKYAVGPWLKRLETRLTMLLPRGQYAKFNAGALLRTDLKTRYESYAIGLDKGFLTIDEVRELEDREPLPAPATPALLESVA